MLRSVGLAIAYIIVGAISSRAEVLSLPPGTTGISALQGEVTDVQVVRIPLGTATTGAETRVTLNFRLQGCLDQLLPVFASPQVQEPEVTFYVTALNAHNEMSRVTSCIAMPERKIQLRVPGIFQRDQVQVVFLKQRS